VAAEDATRDHNRPRDVWPTPMSLVVNVPHTDYGILEDSMSAIGHWLTKELSA
jgi:hypothetical protein